MNLILIGFMGSGKTTIGKNLTKQLEYRFIDTDALIERKIKMPIKKIFFYYGEHFFRRLEHYILVNIDFRVPFVLSTGGGMPCYKNNIEIMKKKGIVVYLKMPKSRLLKTDKSNRPLFEKSKIFLNKRKYCYAKADFTIENDKMDATLKKLIQLVR